MQAYWLFWDHNWLSKNIKLIFDNVSDKKNKVKSIKDYLKKKDITFFFNKENEDHMSVIRKLDQMYAQRNKKSNFYSEQVLAGKHIAVTDNLIDFLISS